MRDRKQHEGIYNEGKRSKWNKMNENGTKTLKLNMNDYKHKECLND